MGAEALLIFNPHLQEGSDHLQKQTLQLLSKMRYLSAQYIPFFKNDLWHTLAAHANQKAQEIASIITSTPGLSLSYPVETNQVFSLPPHHGFLFFKRKFSAIIGRRKKMRFALSHRGILLSKISKR